MPVADDVRLFRRSSASRSFQAGLSSWLLILRKRDAFRRAFAGFDFERVAKFGGRDVARLLADASIVRHRGKIEAVINNAARAVELVAAKGSLAAYVWGFEPLSSRIAAVRDHVDAPPSSSRTPASLLSPRTCARAGGGSSGRRRRTPSCRRWGSSTITSRPATCAYVGVERARASFTFRRPEDSCCERRRSARPDVEVRYRCSAPPDPRLKGGVTWAPENYSCHSRFRSTGTRSPPAVTPSTSSSAEPIMKSMC